jgi:hypothetical protein
VWCGCRYKNFEFKRGEEVMSLEAAMAKFKTHNYGTGVIQVGKAVELFVEKRLHRGEVE